MPRIDPHTLTEFTTAIFAATNIPKNVARQVAESLVLANLKGHDSHGVIRVLEYVKWAQRGWVNPSGKLTIVHERTCILILDGDYGFGQVIGREAMRLAISKAQRDGACIMSLKRSGHLGRVGEWMEMGAAEGLVGFGFTNTHGGGILVAPYGGCDRRLSANPLVAGAPLSEGPDLIMDISTSTIAEGKIKVARSKNESLPSGMIVDGNGQPTTNPDDYYREPPGALLPMGGHKGFALSLCCEIMAGAMTGAGCSKKGVDRIANGFMAFLLNPSAFAGREFVDSELRGLVHWLKSSRLQEGFASIMTPGEPEANNYAARAEQIEIDGNTWHKICRLASERRVAIPPTK